MLSPDLYIRSRELEHELIKHYNWEGRDVFLQAGQVIADLREEIERLKSRAILQALTK